MPILHFDDSDVSVDDLMELLLNWDKKKYPYARNKVMCQGINLSDEGFLMSLGEAVERCYYKKYPLSFMTPQLEMYDPCGDDVVYIASLRTKWGRKINWSVKLTKSNK